jgi:hypothetical protein
MKRICVYSGSNLGVRPEYKEMTKKLGLVLVKNNIEWIKIWSNGRNRQSYVRQ